VCEAEGQHREEEEVATFTGASGSIQGNKKAASSSTPKTLP
jgi:hypothetical protein